MSWMMMVCLPFKWTIEIPVSGTGKCCCSPMSPPPDWGQALRHPVPWEVPKEQSSRPSDKARTAKCFLVTIPHATQQKLLLAVTRQKN